VTTPRLTGILDSLEEGEVSTVTQGLGAAPEQDAPGAVSVEPIAAIHGPMTGQSFNGNEEDSWRPHPIDVRIPAAPAR